MYNVFKEEDSISKYVLMGVKIVVFAAAFTIALCMLFGFKFLKITSESMTPKYLVGDVIMVNTKYDFDKLKIGDVITYKSGSNNVTHRIVEFAPNGLPVTQGDANATIDTVCGSNVNIVTGITEENFVGKVTLGVKGLGKLLDSVAKPSNFLILAVCLVLVLFVMIM